MLLFALVLMMLATAAERIPVEEGLKGQFVICMRNELISVKRLCSLVSVHGTSFAKKNIKKIQSFACNSDICNQI